MAVVLLQEYGAIIDHEAWLLQLNRHKLYQDGRRLKFQGLFDIRTPFLMDGQAQKIAEKLDENEEVPEPKRKKKKEQVSGRSLHSEAEMNHILSKFTALSSTPEFRTTFYYVPKSEDYKINNLKVRHLRTRVMEASSIVSASLDETTEGPDFSTKVINGTNFVIPPNVRYICDDISNILSYTSDDKFDFIVADPPWQNKHVRRKKSLKGSKDGYNMMSVKDVLKIPVDPLLKDGGILAVWSTNKSSQIQEFLQGLHKWGVEHIATWYWLKVTKAGHLVTPHVGSGHTKLPYERVFIASKRQTKVFHQSIPDGFVFCSVPSGIHSHKPPLFELMKPFLASEPQCLELFARSLIPGWTSFGLEVLRLQHSYLFEDLEDDGSCTVPV